MTRAEYLLTASVLTVALLAGCEKTTTTRTDASGSTTTTTAISATPTASAALSKAGDVAVDSATTVKIKSALLADPEIKSLRIDVDTKDGAVTLSGTVPSKANAERAATVAKGVDGVRSVANRLTVKAPG
jgi:hyperosmotically inducible periplasmic protein